MRVVRHVRHAHERVVQSLARRDSPLLWNVAVGPML
jgi:hypothetical protein